MTYISCYKFGDSFTLTKAKSPFYLLVKQYTYKIYKNFFKKKTEHTIPANCQIILELFSRKKKLILKFIIKQFKQYKST